MNTKREYGYYWVRWGDRWVIAQWFYDDDCNYNSEIDDYIGEDGWCWSGMKIIAKPDEVDERQIVRDLTLVQPQP